MFKKHFCFNYIISLVPWDQAPKWGKKAKNRVRLPLVTSWLASLADFFLPFPPMQACKTQSSETVP